jgi:hypothetical protein
VPPTHENKAMIVNTIMSTRTKSNPKGLFQAGSRIKFSVAKKHPSKLLVRIIDKIPVLDSEWSRRITCLVLNISAIILHFGELVFFFKLVLGY